MWLLEALAVWVLISLVASGFIGHFLAGKYGHDRVRPRPGAARAQDDGET